MCVLCTHAHVYRSQGVISVSSSIVLHIIFWGRVSQWTWCLLTGLAAGQQVPRSLVSLRPQLWCYRQELLCLAFYMSAGDLNSGPHTCWAGCYKLRDLSALILNFFYVIKKVPDSSTIICHFTTCIQVNYSKWNCWLQRPHWFPFLDHCWEKLTLVYCGQQGGREA